MSKTLIFINLLFFLPIFWFGLFMSIPESSPVDFGRVMTFFPFLVLASSIIPLGVHIFKKDLSWLSVIAAVITGPLLFLFYVIAYDLMT